MTAFLIILAVLTAAFVYKIYQERTYRLATENRAKERKRLDNCKEVVLYFANYLGYIARQSISRGELEALIDSGIEAPELWGEIERRINQQDGLILGYHPVDREGGIPVKLTPSYQDRHIYIIGKSGAGKTNLLRNMIFQHIQDGQGVGVIAPEQEMLTEEILPYIPNRRIEDVVYFNPADTDFPVSFNPLHIDPGEDIDLRADETLTIMKRVVGETGARMDEILRHTIYALMEQPHTTLLDVSRLLDRVNPTFRNHLISTTSDEQTRHFFRDVYPSFPKDAHLPIINRIGRFVRPKYVRNMLCHPEASFNFRRAMDEGKILLFNLSDGILGEMTSQLIGQLLISKLQMTTMSRADVTARARRKFYLYIDEFQAFTGTSATSYEKLLSRARKYKLCFILAHQQTGQIPLDLLREIFGNVSTMISFTVSSDDAVKLSKELIVEWNGDYQRLPPEELLKLRVGEAVCKIGKQSFFMRTYLADQAPDYRYAQAVIERSRRNFGVTPFSRDKKGQYQETTPDKNSSDLANLDPSEVF